jgi:hypothetical protein
MGLIASAELRSKCENVDDQSPSRIYPAQLCSPDIHVRVDMASQRQPSPGDKSPGYKRFAHSAPSMGLTKGMTHDRSKKTKQMAAIDCRRMAWPPVHI